MSARTDEAHAAAQGHVHQGATRTEGLTLDADVVVVGSGAGGAVVAATLAEGGQQVVLLEEGAYFPQREYAQLRTSQFLRKLWRDAGLTFALGVGDSPLINVMMGKAVGGSSVLTGGVCFRTPGSVLHTWRHQRGLSDFTEEHLAPYFDEVEEAVHVEEVPEALFSGSTRLFAKGAKGLGYALKPMRRNTEGCQGHSKCNFGCPEGAKLSVDLNYLPRAFRAGAQLYTHCLVERVTQENGRATGVQGRLLNGPRGAPKDRLTVRARRVVLAAGAYHTPLILQASGVGRASEQVGRHMTLQGAWSDAFEDQRITLTAMHVPPGVIAATLPGIGAEHRRVAELIPYVSCFGGMLHDEGGGTVHRGPGREPLATYRLDPRDKAAAATLMRVMARTWFEAGAREVYLPVLGLGPVSPERLASLDLDSVPGARLECSSQHPLGTCRMSHSAEAGVLDQNGEAWDLEELFVADGSVVPTSLGVNPQVTIMALALRTARRMLEWKLP